MYSKPPEMVSGLVNDEYQVSYQGEYKTIREKSSITSLSAGSRRKLAQSWLPDYITEVECNRKRTDSTKDSPKNGEFFIAFSIKITSIERQEIYQRRIIPIGNTYQEHFNILLETRKA